jgi:hypothetical protein
MKHDDWVDFKNDVNNFLKQQNNKLLQKISTEEELNRSWHILNEAIKQAANKNIPKTKTCPKTHYAFSKKATKLHAALQKINQIIIQLKSSNINAVSTTIQEINCKTNKINSYTEMQLPKFKHLQSTSTILEETIYLLKHQQKMIYQARKIENNLAHKQKIKNNIIKWHNNFMTNTTKMINSILQRYTDPVIFNNITHSDKNTADPKEIKKEIKKHFEEWTKNNPTNDSYWSEWQEQYRSYTRVNKHWYNTLSNPITLQELQTNLQESPNGKATRPQQISNEMLKHLNIYALNLLLEIFNASITLSMIPKM